MLNVGSFNNIEKILVKATSQRDEHYKAWNNGRQCADVLFISGLSIPDPTRPDPFRTTGWVLGLDAG